MKDHPILFSAPMVRAILAGTKTQTRRPVKPQPYSVALVASGNHLFDYRSDLNDYSRVVPMEKAVKLCPYGQPGDRLWVRETFQIDAPRDGTWHDTQWYGCKGSLVSEIPERFQHPRFCNYAADWLHGRIKWRPGIHMPRWASRITLLVKEVRIERLQSISEADAIAEGIEKRANAGQDSARWRVYGTVDTYTSDPVSSYQSLWESINGAGSWKANPWVFVITYERIKA